MRKDSAFRVLEIAAIALGALLVVGVLTFAGPCVHDDGTLSTCHDAQLGILAAGVAAIALAFGALASKSRVVSGALSLAAAACGVFSALAPGIVFPLCMMETMRCHVMMQPFAELVGIVLAAVAAMAAIRAFRAREPKGDRR